MKWHQDLTIQNQIKSLEGDCNRKQETMALL